MKTTRERIDALIWKLAASGYGTDELNTRALPLSRILRDLTFLEIRAPEYRVAAGRMKASGDANAWLDYLETVPLPFEWPTNGLAGRDGVRSGPGGEPR